LRCGAVAALNGYQHCIEAMRLKFYKRRKYVISELNLMGYEMAPAAVIAHRISAGFFSFIAGIITATFTQ
jgi:aspartate/methionine/tyrosine aminotransferase